MTKCSRHLSHWFPASARELLSHDALFPLFSVCLHNAIDSQSLILSRNIHPSVRNWCFLKQDEAAAHHFQLTDRLWSATYLQQGGNTFVFFQRPYEYICCCFLVLFFCFCNILLYAPNSIALGSPSLTWRTGSFCTTTCSAVLSAFEAERKDEDFPKHICLKDKFQRRLQIQPEFINCHSFAVCVSHVTQFAISVCGLRNRKKSVWNHISNVYISPPTKCWLILRLWWLRVFAQRRGSRRWMFVLMPADSHQQHTDGPTRDRLRIWPLWSRHGSPSELFPPLRRPFSLRPPPPLALLMRSPLNCLGFNAEAVSSPIPVCTFIFW